MAIAHITVVTLNWRACDATLAALRDLRRQTHPALRTIVVDNGSGDGSAERIRTEAPEATVIALPENLGFAAGVNRALRVALATPTDYILLLNNDAALREDSVAQLAAAMERRPEVGVASPKIYYAGQTARLWGVGGAMLPHWMVVYGMDEDDRGQHDRRPLDFVFGCAMIVRRAVFERVGLLDERFFVYYEDADFCLRAREAGYEVALFPDIVVEHEGSHSTARQLHWRTFLHVRNRMIFFHKRLRGPALWRFYMRESLYVASVVGRSLARGDRGNAAAYLSGLAQGLAHGHLIGRRPAAQ